ncbi:MAG: LysR substrate-binding domain-containing protein [Polyangia bacterium]
MDVLSGMRAFRAVAVAGSFVAAARTQAVTTAWISKLVLQLEEHLGVQLLARTTRRISLTDAGRLYLQRCAQILDDLDEAERSVGDLRVSPRGVLRVSAPMSFGLLRLSPLLPAFHRRFPDVELDVGLNDRMVDLVEEGFDVAVRIRAQLESSSLVARRLMSGARVLCASPAYLAARGVPRHPRELAQHACLRYSLHDAPGRWEFERSGERASVDVRGPLLINSGIAQRDAALAGIGILLTPDFMVADALQAGTLVRVLPEFQASGYSVFAVSPPVRFATAKARAFIDFLQETLAPAGGTPR